MHYSQLRVKSRRIRHLLVVEEKMEVNRREVPLYGQVEARLMFQAIAPQDAEFYVVLQGSRLAHVTAAKREDDGLTLCFTAPGHDLAEVVSVTSYFYAEGQVKPCEGETSLEYVRDVAQEAAEYLSANEDQLGPQSYREVLKRFSTWTQGAAEEPSAGPLDRNEEDVQLRESSGNEADVRQLDEKITMAMANMDYPQQWKNTDKQPREGDEIGLPKKSSGCCHNFTTSWIIQIRSPGPVVGTVPGVWCVWSDSSHMMRFCPGRDSLTLSVRQAHSSCPQEGIMFLRDRLEDHSVLKLIAVLRADSEVDKRDTNEGLPSDEGASKELRVEERELVDNADDADTRCSVSGVTTDSTGTDSGLWDTVDSDDLLLATDTPPPYSEDSPQLSPADQALTRLKRLASSESTNQRGSPPMDTCDLSPSLVALEVDSEEDSIDSKSPLSPLSSDVEKNQDKTETVGPSPDLTCTRSQSASSACEHTTKELGDQGIRLRSYSYSSPKISLRPARFARDNHTSDTSPGCLVTAGRSVKFAAVSFVLVLQSWFYVCHWEIRFRKRAQSADDEGNMELAESLQHLTLSEFLKEIEEEELDKYNIPTKVESEKYKVIRTFSFLKNRMASTRNKTKKLQDKYAITTVKNKTASLPQNFTVRDSPPQCVIPISNSLPVMTPKERKDAAPLSCTLSGSFPNSDSRLSESSEAELDTWKVTSQSDELQPTPVSSSDSFFGEDCVEGYIHCDISVDAVDYVAESWSLTVEHKFCKKQDKRAVKRQDVIYELMQTEVHHLQTLYIMAEVFRRGMKDEVQLDTETVERVFPCLDQLLLFHHAFFAALKERRHNSAQPQGHRNYLIQRIGDVLLQQFSDENGEKMRQLYGEFCSRHNEAVSFFKELLQHNKRFQNFIKQQGNNSLVRRREIPECILLVTQRITKYPVLLERILHYTQEETEEHTHLSKALVQIREVIAAVDLSVSEYERHQRLQEVWNRMENRSTTKLKNGHTFRKQDMMAPGQTLKHQGLLLWKTATGRLKDVLALLLVDTLIFLQEKDQKYTFATVDQKPPVIALQKLIVREVANEERGMFLISASAAGPEMYEVHTSSKDERNTWMRLIREAVESCPEEEEEYTSESEEEKRVAEARIQKIHKIQESLMNQDQQICSCLEEKLQIFAELSALSGRMDASSVEQRLLVQPHSEELPQAAVLLNAALQEAESLKATLSSKACSPSSHSLDSDTDTVFPVSPATLEEAPSDLEANEGSWTEAHLQKTDTNNIDFKAAVTIQDSCYEVQRLLLQENGRPSPRAQRPHLPSVRCNTLQEQEKQRNMEKRKEEVAAAQRLQDRLRLEKERWEKECQARESQQGEQESRLEERERQCHLEAERLRREREELDEQLEEYQQSLERLREGQRSVEKERERLENQQQLLHNWRHGRQRSLPAVIPHMVIPLDGQQDSAPSQSRGHAGNGSVFVNEAAFASTSLNNRHFRHKGNDPSAYNCLNTLLARSNGRQQTSITKTPHNPHSDSQGWTMGPGYFYSPAGRLGLEQMPSDHNSHSYIGDTWSSTASGADPYQGLPHPSDPHLGISALVSLETDSGGEEGREETIVYL
ncbi:hypothetical protein PAMP_013050 [Pampus punctatissimus]